MSFIFYYLFLKLPGNQDHIFEGFVVVFIFQILFIDFQPPQPSHFLNFMWPKHSQKTVHAPSFTLPLLLAVFSLGQIFT